MGESTKYQEPDVLDPRTLQAGDQVGCLDSGTQLRLMVGEPYGHDDAVWVTLHNAPGETTHLWDEPVPHGNVALKMGGYDHDWKVVTLPQVWARRRIW